MVLVFRRKYLIDRSYKAVRLFHALALVGALFISGFSEISTSLILVTIVLSILAIIFGVNIINHRYCAHHTFEVSSVISFIWLLFHSMVGLNSPITSSVMHEAHHQYSDTDLDPHPYPKTFFKQIKFFFRIYFHHLNVNPPLRRIMSYSRRRWFLLFHKYGAFFSFGISGVLWAIGFEYLIFLQTIPVWMAFFCHYWLAGPMHRSRSLNRDTKDYSVNSAVLNVLTLGEGNHYLHHRYAKRVYFPLSVGNRNIFLFDLTGYLVKTFFLKEASPQEASREAVSSESSKDE